MTDQPIQPIQPIQSPEPVQVDPPIQSAESVQADQPIQSAESLQVDPLIQPAPPAAWSPDGLPAPQPYVYGEPAVAAPSTVPVATAAVRSGSLGRGIAAGFAAAVVGAMVWAALTALTGYELGIAAVGVGLLVGFAVHQFGGAPTKQHLVAAVVLGAFGAVLGLFAEVGVTIAKTFDASVSEVLTLTDWAVVARELVKEPFTWLWTAIAAWSAARLVMRRSAG